MILRRNIFAKIFSVLMAMALVMLLAPSVFAEENSDDVMVYDDPDHADIQTVVNEESGELYDISSGVTHYEEKNLSNLLSRAAWDGNYADVFYDITSYSKDEQPFNNQSEVKVDLKFKVPATAVGGDTFTFTVSQGYRFHIITSPIYIADANGLVFAKFVAPSWDSATITLTDAVEKFQNIQGSITGLGFSINQPATAGKYALNLISPNGTKLGPGTEYDLAKPAPPSSGIVAGARSYGNDPGYYLAQRFVKSSGKVPGNLNPSQVRSELVLTSSGQKIDCNLLRDENIAFWQWVLPNNLLVQAGKLNVVSCTSTKVVVTPYNAPTAVPSAYVGIRLEIPVITEKEHTSGYAFSAAGYVNNSLVFDGLGTATSGSSNSSEIGGENLAISVDKSASVNSLVIGDHVNYTIVVTADKSNAGTAYNVELADRLPENLQYVSSSDNGVYDSSTHVVNWGGWNYDPGQVRTFTVTTKVLSRPSDGKIVNIALLDGANVCVGNSGGSTNSVCKDDETISVLKPDFDFTKSATIEDTNNNGYIGDKGDNIVYTFNIKNTGETILSTAKFSDPLLGITDRECLSAPLAPGANVNCDGTFTHTITQDDVDKVDVVNNATMCLDPILGVDCKPGTTTTETANLSFKFMKYIDKVEDTNKNTILGGAGDTVHYKFNISNTGSVPIKSAKLSDNLLNVKDAECLASPLAVGATAICQGTYTHVITDAEATAGKIDNIATLTIPNGPSETDEATLPVYKPGVAVLKTSTIEDTNKNGILGDAGDTIKYNFKITNTGNSVLQNVTMTDKLLNLDDYECLVTPLAVGASVNCATSPVNDFSHVITTDEAKSGKVVNNVVVETPGAPPAPGEVTDNVYAPGVNLKKSSVMEDTNKDGFLGNAGDTIKYSFKVTNTGNSILTTAKLTDDLLGLKDYECLTVPLAVGASVNCAEQKSGDFSHGVTKAEGKAGKVVNHATVTTPGAPGSPDENTNNVYEPGIALNKTSVVEDTNKDGFLGNAGDTIKYTFKITNTGNSVIKTAKLNDSLLKLKDYECLDKPLNPGVSVNCIEQKAGDFSYVITVADGKVGNVKNNATIDTPGAPPGPGQTTEETFEPGIALNKTSVVEDTNKDGFLGNAGDTIKYTFKITNTGNSIIKTAKLDDDVLKLKDYECLAGPLAPGKSVNCVEQKAGDFSYVITVADGKAGKVENHATVNTPGAPPGPGETTDEAYEPGIFLLKASTVEDTNKDGVVGNAGDTIRYTFTITNTGNSVIKTAKLSDDLLQLKDYECLAKPLNPGESVDCIEQKSDDFSYVIAVADGKAGNVKNNAVVVTPGAPPAPGETVAPTYEPGIALEKTSTVEDTNKDGFVGNAGDTIKYAFQITNTGNSVITTAKLNDDLLKLKDYECLSVPLAVGGVVNCVEQKPGDFSYVITEADGKAGKVENHATITTPGAPPGPGENIEEVYEPGIALEKSSVVEDTNKDNFLGNAGDTIKYTFQITNTGNSEITTAKLNDNLLKLKDYECLVGPLAPGKSVNCVEQEAGDFSYIITEADGKAGKVENHATIETPGAPSAPGENVEDVYEPGIELEKTSSIEDTNEDGFLGNAGDTIKYVFKITNTGNSVITTAKLNDELLNLKNYECLAEPLAVGASVGCIEQKAGDFSHVITESEGEAGEVANQAVIETPGAPPGLAEVIDAVFMPMVELDKQVAEVRDSNDNHVVGDAGDTIVYKFVVKNVGNSVITSALLTDELLGVKDHQCLVGVAQSQSGDAEIGLKPGESAICAGEFTYVITEEDMNAGEVHNVATVNVPGALEATAEADVKTDVPPVDLDKGAITGQALSQRNVWLIVIGLIAISGAISGLVAINRKRN